MHTAAKNMPIGLPASRGLGVTNEKLQTLIHIKELKHGQVSGVIQNIQGGMIVPFHDLGDLIIKLDDMADMAQIPAQAGPRSALLNDIFRNSARYYDETALFEVNVTILFRKHFSLQGQLSVTGIPAVLTFRSALELAHIIHSTVCDYEDLTAEEG